MQFYQKVNKTKPYLAWPLEFGGYFCSYFFVFRKMLLGFEWQVEKKFSCLPTEVPSTMLCTFGVPIFQFAFHDCGDTSNKIDSHLNTWQSKFRKMNRFGTGEVSPTHLIIHADDLHTLDEPPLYYSSKFIT